MEEPEVENADVPEGYFKNEEEPPMEDPSLPAHVKKGVFPPPMDLFGPSQTNEVDMDRETIAEQGLQVISTLADFGIQAELAETVIGPTVIQFQIQLAPGVKVSRVAGLSNDLAVSLAVPALRVEAPIPFKPYVGIEIPRPNRRSVTIRSILETDDFKKTHFNLPLAAGLKVNSNPLLINLEDLPHLLVAGTTGSGKSVFVTSCITGLCCQRTPDELRLLMIDPKRVELNIYENLPHVLSKPVVDPRKAVHALGWAVREMEHRYEVFARTRVRNLASYNSKVLPKDKLPRIVIIVDELADLMFTAQKEVEDFICRLAQMARATGIHLILATQRPSVNVITGLIKANIPARVAFTLPSQADSRTIIDVGGAEKLLGKGDMLFVSSKYPRPVRVQAPYMDETQSLNFISYMKDLFGEPEYVDLEDQGDVSVDRDTAFLDDPLIEEAVNIILGTGIASASRLQRQLRIGFTRAARIIDTLEQMGIVGPQEGSKPREILADEEKVSEIFENIG
jgi:S-DNA-T family DNA segregation ATPase FtsK/SpoIIIE